jgi:vacuolar-type H+-ATPase subunit H
MGVELDPPPLEGVEKQRDRRFKVVRRGFDPMAVDEFLMTVASRIEALEAALQQAQVLPPSPAVDVSDREPKRVARLGAVGEREVERMLAEAKEEAATIVAEARSEAERIKSDAEIAAKPTVEEAGAFLTKVGEDAGRTLSNVAERRRQMIEELQKMQDRLLRVSQDLDLVLNPAGPDAPERSTGVESGTDP